MSRQAASPVKCRHKIRRQATSCYLKCPVKIMTGTCCYVISRHLTSRRITGQMPPHNMTSSYVMPCEVTSLNVNSGIQSSRVKHYYSMSDHVISYCRNLSHHAKICKHRSTIVGSCPIMSRRLKSVSSEVMPNHVKS